VSGLIQRELSDLIVRKIKDPRLGLVTVTRVNVTDDLRLARIYFSVGEGHERRQNALAGFKSAMGYLRHTLSHRLGLRYMPELRFIYDGSFDRADTINRIIKTIHNETDSTLGKSPKT
jgi:ribosome-binding factor A